MNASCHIFHHILDLCRPSGLSDVGFIWFWDSGGVLDLEQGRGLMFREVMMEQERKGFDRNIHCLVHNTDQTSQGLRASWDFKVSALLFKKGIPKHSWAMAEEEECG